MSNRKCRITTTILATILGVLACAGVVLASYTSYIPITVSENASTSHTYLPVIASVNNTYLADNGYINSTGLDTRVTESGTTLEHLVTDNKTLFVLPSLSADGSAVARYELNWDSDLDSMPVIVGNDGYVTVTDDAALEPGDNFTVELKGWVDTSNTNGILARKPSAFAIWESSSSNISSSIFDTWDSPTSGSGTSWLDIADAYDDNTGTYALYPNIAATSWSTNLTLTLPSAVTCDSIRYYAGGATADIDAIDIDVYDNSAWYDVYQGGFAQATWETRAIPDGILLISQARIRLYNSSGAGVDGYVYEFDFGSASTSVTATGVSSGSRTIKVTADGTNLKIYVDDIEKDSAALSGASVPDNSSDWTLIQNNIMPYMDYYKHTVNGTLVAWYQPVDMISGTTLPDREGAAQDGAITWGGNPAGVTVSMDSLTLADITAPSTPSEPAPPDVVAETSGADPYDEDVAGLPGYEYVDSLLVARTGLSASIWYQVMALVIVALIGAAMLTYTGSVLLTALAMGIIIAVFTGVGMLPLWTVIVYGVIAVGFVIFSKVFSI